MTTQDLSRQSKLHARTLAALNHCVDTARRDAAAQQLFIVADRTAWPESQSERVGIYNECLHLVKEILDATQRSSPILYNSRLALSDKPVIHFLVLMQQLLQTVLSTANHIEAVKKETTLLNEHIGDEALKTLLGTCKDFELYEIQARNALRKLTPAGALLIRDNSAKRQAAFTPQEQTRYQKAYKEFEIHYSSAK